MGQLLQTLRLPDRPEDALRSARATGTAVDAAALVLRVRQRWLLQEEGKQRRRPLFTFFLSIYFQFPSAYSPSVIFSNEPFHPYMCNYALTKAACMHVIRVHEAPVQCNIYNYKLCLSSKFLELIKLLNFNVMACLQFWQKQRVNKARM